MLICPVSLQIKKNYVKMNNVKTKNVSYIRFAPQTCQIQAWNLIWVVLLLSIIVLATIQTLGRIGKNSYKKLMMQSFCVMMKQG